MRKGTLDSLACPSCLGGLVAAGDAGGGAGLRCPRCGREYPIREGIAHFIRPGELTGTNRRLAYLYDRFSHVYAAFSRLSLALLGGEGRSRRDVLRRLQPRGGRVLEVSIGPGVNLPYLYELPGVTEVYGLDISLGQLRRCRSLCRRRRWEVDLFLGTAEALPFRGDSFDAVLHIGGINFFNDKRRAIEEMIRVARPGARIVIADENERGARFYERTLPGFRGSFRGGRARVSAPVDLVPAEMLDLKVGDVWGGWFYCVEFRKPEGRT